MLAGDFVEHEETPGLAPAREGVLEFFRLQRAAFPDMRLDPEDVLPSGDKVVARARMTGTHQGELMGLPATGRRVDVQLIDIIRFGEDGLAHEHWGVFDLMALMQQLARSPQARPREVTRRGVRRPGPLLRRVAGGARRGTPPRR